MYFYLYKITNLINNKIYVGVHRTLNLNDNYMGSGNLIKQAIKKYGINNFRRDILEFFENENEMFNKEAEVVNGAFIERKDVYNLSEGGKGCSIEKSLVSKKKHREQTILMSPSCKDKDSEEYKIWYSKYIENAPILQAKDSEKFQNWLNSRKESFPTKGDNEDYKKWISSHPQLKDKDSIEYLFWYAKWEKNACHIKDKDSPEFLTWKDKTKKAIPQLKDKESKDFKDWYSKAMNNHPSCKDKNSESYKNWYEKTMEGKRKHKKTWVYNDFLRKSSTIDIEDLNTYIEKGWIKGRKFYE